MQEGQQRLSSAMAQRLVLLQGHHILPILGCPPILILIFCRWGHSSPPALPAAPCPLPCHC